MDLHFIKPLNTPRIKGLLRFKITKFLGNGLSLLANVRHVRAYMYVHMRECVSQIAIAKKWRE